MKVILSTIFVIGFSGSVALAAGCSDHGSDAAMNCETGKVWDDKAKACVDSNA